MKSKILALVVVLVVFGSLSTVFAACDATHMKVEVQESACVNDTILVRISNITNCSGEFAKVYYNGDLNNKLCEVMCLNETCLCSIDVPEVIGTLEIDAELNQNTASTNINIHERTKPFNCYNKYGVKVDCDYNCSPVNERIWEDVLPVSLPMHFTFGLKSEAFYWPVTSLGDNSPLYGVYKGQNLSVCDTPPNCNCPSKCEQDSSNPMWISSSTDEGLKAVKYLFGNYNWPGVYKCTNYYDNPNTVEVSQEYAAPNIFNSDGSTKEQNAPEFPNSGCVINDKCTWETHNTTRYTFKFKIDYDVVTSVYTKNEYVPIYVGLKQEPLPNGNANFGCSKNGSLCYTEIPLCGDGVCSVDDGENCVNCPDDCYSGPTSEFEGDCTNNGCVPCRPQQGYIDERGCVIEKAKEGEDCVCDEICEGSYKCVWTKWDIETGLEDGQLDIGKCCYEGEIWKEYPDVELGPHCFKPRKVEVESVKLETKDVPRHGLLDWTQQFAEAGVYASSKECCAGAPATFLKVEVTFANHGSVPEDVRAWVELPEDKPHAFGPVYALIQQVRIKKAADRSFTISGESRSTQTFYLDCAVIESGYCDISNFGSIYDPTNWNLQNGQHPLLKISFEINGQYQDKITGHTYAYTPGDIFSETYITEGYNNYTVYCDLVSGVCTNGVMIDKSGMKRMVYCGGNPDWPDLVPHPWGPLGRVVLRTPIMDCNPWD